MPSKIIKNIPVHAADEALLALLKESCAEKITGLGKSKGTDLFNRPLCALRHFLWSPSLSKQDSPTGYLLNFVYEFQTARKLPPLKRAPYKL